MDRINYKYGIGLKISDGKYKYDIDSILDEQIQFYSNLFKSDGWDKNWQFIVNKLHDKDMLDSNTRINIEWRG
jgi:hypothetical protein